MGRQPAWHVRCEGCLRCASANPTPLLTFTVHLLFSHHLLLQHASISFKRTNTAAVFVSREEFASVVER